MARATRLVLAVTVLAGGLFMSAGTAHATGWSLTVGSVGVWEGDSGSVTVKVPVDLSAPLPLGVVVTATYRVSAGSAAPGDDFYAYTGTLRFTGAGVAKKIAVTVNGDRFRESDETINVTLSNV